MREKKQGQGNRREAKCVPGDSWEVASTHVCPPGNKFPGKGGAEHLPDSLSI